MKFPIQHEFLIHAEVVDISKRSTAKFASILYFLDKFPGLKKDVEQINKEFLRYQVDKLPAEVEEKERIDEKVGN